MSLDESVSGRIADDHEPLPPYLTPTEIPVGDAYDPNTPPYDPATDMVSGGTAGPGGPVPPGSSSNWADYGQLPPPGSAARRRWRIAPRTLTARLVTGVVGLIVVVVVLSGAVTYAAFASFLTNRLDQQVGGAADTNIIGSRHCISIAPVQCDLSYPGRATTGSTATPTLRGTQGLWFAILDPSGRDLPLQSGSVDLILLTLTPKQRAAVLASPGTYRSITVDGEAVRITARVINTNVGPYYEVVGLSGADVSNALHRLLLIELAIGGGAVLIALTATLIGVRWSLRPLRRVTTTARTVAAELSPEGAGLDRRVPLTETETDTEVGRLAESFNTLLGAVETQFAARMESDQRIRQFMADASHELRTPLTSIRGYAELARMRRQLDGDEATVDSDADALGRIEAEGTRMSRLIDDLLTLARGDIGAPVQNEPVDIAELVDDAVEGAQAAHPERRFGATSFPGITVWGDHDQLLRVVRNLVTNAAVHTAPGGPIRVNATLEGGQAVIRVIDAGPGLPPEQAAHVFERFWRSDASRARTSGGSGLGLAIVASIVAAHGGTVRFDSSVEAGSTVTVSLPAR